MFDGKEQSARILCFLNKQYLLNPHIWADDDDDGDGPAARWPSLFVFYRLLFNEQDNATLFLIFYRIMNTICFISFNLLSKIIEHGIILWVMRMNVDKIGVMKWDNDEEGE